MHAMLVLPAVPAWVCELLARLHCFEIYLQLNIRINKYIHAKLNKAVVQVNPLDFRMQPCNRLRNQSEAVQDNTQRHLELKVSDLQLRMVCCGTKWVPFYDVVLSQADIRQEQLQAMGCEKHMMAGTYSSLPEPLRMTHEPSSSNKRSRHKQTLMDFKHTTMSSAWTRSLHKQ